MQGPVLIAVHDSAHEALVVGRGAQLAAAFGVELHAVSVVPTMDVAAPVAESAATTIAAEDARHRRTAETALGRAATVAAAVDVEPIDHLERGEPAARIRAVADEIGAALIVIGSTGLDAAGRYVLGSVPERVLFDSHGHDVLVVRTTDG